MVLGYLIVLCIAMYCIDYWVCVFLSLSLFIDYWFSSSINDNNKHLIFYFHSFSHLLVSVSSNDKTQSKTKDAPPVTHSQADHTTSSSHTLFERFRRTELRLFCNAFCPLQINNLGIKSLKSTFKFDQLPLELLKHWFSYHFWRIKSNFCMHVCCLGFDRIMWPKNVKMRLQNVWSKPWKRFLAFNTLSDFPHIKCKFHQNVRLGTARWIWLHERSCFNVAYKSHAQIDNVARFVFVKCRRSRVRKTEVAWSHSKGWFTFLVLW